MDSSQTDVLDLVPDTGPGTGPDAVPASLGRRLLALIIDWAPALAIMSVIFFLSSKPDFGGPAWVSALIRDLLGEGPLLDGIEWLLPYADAYASWAAHFIEYGALGVAFYWGIRRQWPSFRRAGAGGVGNGDCVCAQRRTASGLCAGPPSRLPRHFDRWSRRRVCVVPGRLD